MLGKETALIDMGTDCSNSGRRGWSVTRDGSDQLEVPAGPCPWTRSDSRLSRARHASGGPGGGIYPIRLRLEYLISR